MKSKQKGNKQSSSAGSRQSADARANTVLSDINDESKRRQEPDSNRKPAAKRSAKR